MKPEPHARGGFARWPVWDRNPRIVALLLLIAAACYGFLFARNTSLMLPLFAPLAGLATIIVWLLPDTNRPPVRTLTGLFFLYMIALITWPDYLAFTFQDLPWITAIRLTGPPVVFTLMICVSVSSALRAEMLAMFKSTPWIIWPFVVFCGTMVVTLPLSPDLGTSVGRLVVAVLNWIGMFFVAVVIFRRKGVAEGFVRVLWICLIVTCIFGLLEARDSQVPWAENIPSFLAIQDEAVLRALEGTARAAIGDHRVASKWSTSLGFAEYMVLVTPFLIHAVMTGRNLIVRGLALATIGLVLYCIRLTDARLGMIGFMLSFVLYALIWAVRRWREDRDSLLAPVIVAAYPLGMMVLFAMTFVVGRLRALTWGTGAQQFSTDARIEQYTSGLRHLLSNPIGNGIGMGAQVLGFAGPSGIVTIDTYFLAVALEFGVIGFFAYYGMVVGSIFHGGKGALNSTERETNLLIPTIIALTNFMIIKLVFSQLENHPIVFMMMGMTVALVYRVQLTAGELPIFRPRVPKRADKAMPAPAPAN